VKLALASLDQRWEDRTANLSRCTAIVAEAAGAGAEFVIFPELTLTGFTMNSAAIAEDADASPTMDAFRRLARQHQVHIAFGVALRGARRPRNTLVVAAPDGKVLGTYAKLHPFSHAGEDDHYEGGSSLARVQVAGMTVGLTICYDLRFPELYSALAPSCDAILVIANWPAARIEHWHVLARARAIDGQCFIVAVNRTGTDGNGISYPRSSMVVEPRGSLLEPALSRGELDIFDMDAAAVAHYRRSFPTLRDRRNELYRTMLTG
jgi:predicted amidohydrolase